MKAASFVSIFLFALSGSLFAQNPLESIGNLRLLDDRPLDADSFHATDGETTYHLRLYLVDAPETEAGDSTMSRRVREQTRYFGLPSAEDTLRLGKQAAERTRELLSRPFTAHTAGTGGLGRSSQPRIYAYVVTAEGRARGERLEGGGGARAPGRPRQRRSDAPVAPAEGRHLRQQLEAEGWARAQGMGRVNHKGVAQAEQRARLADLEFAAALQRRGVWELSDPARLLSQREEERREAGELAAISATASGRATGSDGELIDLNTATEARLQSLPGVGPALAARIVEGRPYASVDELTRVSGIGPVALERLRDLVTLSADAP